MQITIDTLHDTPEQMRIAASLLLTLSGDCPMEETTPHTATGEQLDKLLSTPPLPPVPAGTTADAPPPPPPPAPLAAPLAANTAGVTIPLAPPAPSAAAAPAPSAVASAAPAEFDKAGMPWDARIHQKGKSKKKDGTWKLQKGIDQAVVESVVRELAAQRPAAATPAPAAGAVPPPPAAVASPVPLPPVPGSVPVPPPVPVAGSVELPASGVPASVPVPPAPNAAPGTVPTPSAFKVLVDKLAAATNAGRITQQKVAEVVQSCGAPNLMQLNSMPHLIPEVSSRIDAVLAGLM